VTKFEPDILILASDILNPVPDTCKIWLQFFYVAIAMSAQVLFCSYKVYL